MLHHLKSMSFGYAGVFVNPRVLMKHELNGKFKEKSGYQDQKQNRIKLKKVETDETTQNTNCQCNKSVETVKQISFIHFLIWGQFVRPIAKAEKARPLSD